MNPIAVMTATSISTLLPALVVLQRQTALEVCLGMAAPLAATIGTWWTVERVFSRRPEQLTAVMAGAFGAKMLFFGAYVALAIKLLGVHPVPFVVSFTTYFVVLYGIEALYLRRLFMAAPRQSR